MDDLTKRILKVFFEMNSDRLDLHNLLEAGGNDPNAREDVISKLPQLVRQGFLEERGSDFYELTDKAREAMSRKH